jgi:agmatine deiminase
MPAEWAPQEATWMTWPARENTSFPESDHHDAVLPTFLEMVRAITRHQKLFLNCAHAEDRSYVEDHLGREVQNLVLTDIPGVYPWCRDHGSTFVKHATTGEVAAVNWDYNAWGNKYPEILQQDAHINRRMADLLGKRSFEPGFVLEGGSIEVNGEGAVLTTTQCLLNPNRNPAHDKPRIEATLRDYLGVSQVLWLEEGIVGDDTDGHIDDITRFINTDTVLTAVEQDPTDANYAPLRHNLTLLEKSGLNVVPLPMPAPVELDGLRLPASYANFYIGNGFVLQPVFGDKMDDKAVSIIEKSFPGREIIPINCRRLVWGLGTFHCLTQQQPA